MYVRCVHLRPRLELAHAGRAPRPHREVAAIDVPLGPAGRRCSQPFVPCSPRLTSAQRATRRRGRARNADHNHEARDDHVPRRPARGRWRPIDRDARRRHRLRRRFDRRRRASSRPRGQPSGRTRRARTRALSSTTSAVQRVAAASPGGGRRCGVPRCRIRRPRPCRPRARHGPGRGASRTGTAGRPRSTSSVSRRSRTFLPSPRKLPRLVLHRVSRAAR